jgi:hypothetical protein
LPLDFGGAVGPLAGFGLGEPPRGVRLDGLAGVPPDFGGGWSGFGVRFGKSLVGDVPAGGAGIGIVLRMIAVWPTVHRFVVIQ